MFAATKNEVTILPALYEPSRTDYYQAPSGAAIAVPAGMKYLEIAALDAPVWFRGAYQASESISVPSASQDDGQAPRYLAPGARIVLALSRQSHLCLKSSGGVSVSWWNES